MGFFKAITKLIGNTASDKICEKDKRKASKQAYAETGKALQKASKNGKYVNGSKIYQQKKNQKINQANAKNENRKKFMDDLFS